VKVWTTPGGTQTSCRAPARASHHPGASSASRRGRRTCRALARVGAGAARESRFDHDLAEIKGVVRLFAGGLMVTVVGPPNLRPHQGDERSPASRPLRIGVRCRRRGRRAVCARRARVGRRSRTRRRGSRRGGSGTPRTCGRRGLVVVLGRVPAASPRRHGLSCVPWLPLARGHDARSVSGARHRVGSQGRCRPWSRGHGHLCTGGSIDEGTGTAESARSRRHGQDEPCPSCRGVDVLRRSRTGSPQPYAAGIAARPKSARRRARRIQ
jgi:hypothetical protein